MVSIQKLIHPTDLFTGLVGVAVFILGWIIVQKVTGENDENDENDSITSLTSFCGVDARYCCSLVASCKKYASMQGGKK